MGACSVVVPVSYGTAHQSRVWAIAHLTAILLGHLARLRREVCATSHTTGC